MARTRRHLDDQVLTGPTPEYDGPSRPFTVHFEFPNGNTFEHKSMAPHWVRALNLAINAMGVEAAKRGLAKKRRTLLNDNSAGEKNHRRQMEEDFAAAAPPRLEIIEG
ncbi:MAG: hypothetical protein KGO96_10470 [Elusimicrobia bacterium]|nr:hypothetical protein [Elusimicrobiota bacterium]